MTAVPQQRAAGDARIAGIERAGYNLIAARYAAAAQARAAAADALLDAADLHCGQRVLDVASGPGTLTVEAARRVASGGFAVAADLADASLALCRSRARAAKNPAPACVAADAQRLPFRESSFDRVLCGLGLMFFPDAGLAAAQMRFALKPGGTVTLSVWGEAHEVPLVAAALACLRRCLPAPKLRRPSVFRFGDSAVLEATLAGAGLADVRIERFVLESRFPDAAAYWQGFLDLAGGAAWSLARLPDETRAALAGAVREDLAPYRCTEGYILHSTLLIARACRPGSLRCGR